MERVRAASVFRTAFAVGVLVLMVVFTVLLVPRLKLKGLRKPSACAVVFPLKAAFVELNGAYTRVAGRRLCNGVFRGEYGLMLTGVPRRDVSVVAASAAGFSKWLEKRNARYLFVQAPSKADRGDTLHPPFLPHEGNANADDFLGRLERVGVATLDLREA